jgi:hypothetical protein
MIVKIAIGIEVGVITFAKCAAKGLILMLTLLRKQTL